MLAKRCLNALSDRGPSLINAPATCNMYAGAFIKSSNLRTIMLLGSGSRDSLLGFGKCNIYTDCCSNACQSMLRTAGPCSSNGQFRQNIFRRSATMGIILHNGVLVRPAHGIMKWPASGCSPFTTSGRVENEVKMRGRTKRNKGGIEKNSASNTPEICQTNGQQVQDDFKTTKANLKCSSMNRCMESEARENENSERITVKVSPECVEESDKMPTKRCGNSKTNKVNQKHSSANGTQKFQAGGYSKESQLVIKKVNKKHLGANARKESQSEIGQMNKSRNACICDDTGQDAVISNELEVASRAQRKVKKLGGQPSAVNSSEKYHQITEHMMECSCKIVDIEPSIRIQDNKLEKSHRKINAGVPLNGMMKCTGSEKPQAKKSGRAKAKKGDEKHCTAEAASECPTEVKLTKKSSLKTKKLDVKPSITNGDRESRDVRKMSKAENIEVSVTAGEGSVISSKMHSKETSRSKFSKADENQSSVNAAHDSCDQNKWTDKGRKSNSLVCAEGKVVVVVESAAKAKTIQRYLGDMFVVLPSYGHVRDLAARSGSVRPDEDFSMVWEVPSTAWTHLSNMKAALTGARSLVLASDPDREGEAIAWHVTEMLKKQGSLKNNMTVARVVFHEITESAIRNAMAMPRDISMNLVNAYLARRALDYLIGFNISPLLWKKLPGCQSAGRVQSAALSLICDREKEIEEFVSQEFWSVEAKACTSEAPSSDRSVAFAAKVTHVDGQKLEKLSLNSHALAEKVVQKISSSKFKVLDTKRSNMRKNPPLPYITSTLQQDASNKLNFSVTYTMKLAQKLYEGVKLSDNEVTGLITYMRTDGLQISEEAAKSIRSLVTERYGKAYALEQSQKFCKKVKNAQEAHEAIRPTDIRRFPSMLAGILEEDALKLYTLIWCQTMACQMKAATFDQAVVNFGNEEKSILLRSNGSCISFHGYLAVFKDSENLNARDEEGQQKIECDTISNLLRLKVGDTIYMDNVEAIQHFTEPLPRYSEGTLVKKLEELGIGRPSTYAPTLKVLQAREYVMIKSRRIFPEFRGRMVSAFLSHFFSEITNYSFTADMESQLDDVSAGLIQWKNVLEKFWERFCSYRERVIKVDVHQVEKMLEQTYEKYLFDSLPGKSRVCPSCKEGTLSFKVSRHGAGYFIGCDRYPKCSYIATTMFSEEDKDILKENEKKEHVQAKVLGVDPDSDQQVLLKPGPYGYYIQLGEDKKGFTPKRANVSQVKDVGTITLEYALQLLRYPITLGEHPEDNQPVELKRTKFGFAVRHRHFIAKVPKNVDHQTVTLDMAVRYLKGKDAKKIGRPSEGKRGNRPRVLKEAI